MHLQVHNASLADLELAKELYGTETGDLVSPIAQRCWPISDPNDLDMHRRRAEWSMQQQLDMAATQSNVHFVKVVDTDAPAGAKQIVALGRFVYHDAAAEAEKRKQATSQPAKEKKPFNPDLPDGMNKELYIALMSAILNSNEETATERGNEWHLITIVTREPYRRHGAGGMVLKWGLERAKKDGVPCILESMLWRKGWYERNGFREVGRDEVMADGEVNYLCHMRADP